MELFLNLNSNWTCGLKSVSMYFSSDGVTQQVHMIPRVSVKRIIFHSQSDEKKFPNSSKIVQKSRFGAPWEPFWSLLTSILDTCSQKTGFWRLWGASWDPKTANLAPTWKPKTLQNRCKNAKKSMFKNNMFLAWFFLGARASFWKDFWTIF